MENEENVRRKEKQQRQQQNKQTNKQKTSKHEGTKIWPSFCSSGYFYLAHNFSFDVLFAICSFVIFIRPAREGDVKRWNFLSDHF